MKTPSVSGSDAFLTAFTSFQRRHGVTDLGIENDDEGHFSWHPCQCCGSGLGGQRYLASAWHEKTRQILEFRVCTDCIIFSANGDLPETWG